jgi:hypothetical protein
LGPAVGILVLVLIPEMLGLDPLDKQLVFGLILVAVMLLLPRGVVPSVTHAVGTLTARLRPQPPAVEALMGSEEEPAVLTRPQGIPASGVPELEEMRP